MTSNADNLVLGIEFKISIEKRYIEVIEPSLVAPKNALQCTSREEIETDSKTFFEAIDRRALFIRAINEIQKYDWGMISTDAAYQINIPGYDVSYYYVDITSLQTHILKYYMVCHFVSDIAAVIGKPTEDAAPQVNPKRRHLHLPPLGQWATPIKRLTTPIKRLATPIKRWATPKYSAFPIKNIIWYGLFAVAGCALILLTFQVATLLRSHAPAVQSPLPAADPSGLAPATAPPPVPTAGTPTAPVMATASNGGSRPGDVTTPQATPRLAPSTATALPLPGKPPLGAEDDALAQEGTKTMRLQRILITLGFFHGDVNGLMGPQTRKAVADFSSVVPPAIRQHYRTDTLAMAEAALKGEFTLLNQGHP